VIERTVAWGGLHNARDLGGLPAGTATTQRGRVYRTPRLDGLDARGWDELVDAGVRTIVDLRNPHEISPLTLPPSRGTTGPSRCGRTAPSWPGGAPS